MGSAVFSEVLRIVQKQQGREKTLSTPPQSSQGATLPRLLRKERFTPIGFHNYSQSRPGGHGYLLRPVVSLSGTCFAIILRMGQREKIKNGLPHPCVSGN